VAKQVPLIHNELTGNVHTLRCVIPASWA